MADHSPLTGGKYAGVFLGSDYAIRDWVPAEEFHEFHVFDGGRHVIANMGGSVPVPASVDADGRERPATVAERTGFHEFDPTTGKLLFEWQTLDHLDISESTMTPPGSAGTWWEPL